MIEDRSTCWDIRITVESCVLLERVSNRKADSRIRIDVDLEDYYRIKANKSEKA